MPIICIKLSLSPQNARCPDRDHIILSNFTAAGFNASPLKLIEWFVDVELESEVSNLLTVVVSVLFWAQGR